MNFIKKNLFEIVLTILGMTTGYLYWRFIGCTSGTCALKSVWYYNVLFGGLIGYLLSDSVKNLFRRFVKKTDVTEQ